MSENTFEKDDNSFCIQDCVLLSTNWIDGIFDLSFLDYSGAFTESFINLIKAVIPSLLEVIGFFTKALSEVFYVANKSPGPVL